MPSSPVPTIDAPVGPPSGVGICLSGGGIRSASYCLGALQSLDEHQLLRGERGARYLSAVSGGSYIATAITMVAESIDGLDRPAPPPASGTSPPATGTESGPFSHGSPEEKFLRNHTLYLTHGRGGVPAVIWRVLLGVVFNVAIVALGLVVVSVPLGWLYARLWPSLRAGCPADCPSGAPFAIPQGLWLAVIATAVAAFASGFVWLAWRFRKGKWQWFWGTLSGLLLLAAGVILAVFVGIPSLIHLARPYYVSGSAPGSATSTVKATKTVVSVGLLGVLGTWLAAAQALLAKPSGVEKGIISTIKGFARTHRTVIVNAAATVFGPLLVLAGIVALSYWGSGYLPSWSGPGRSILLTWIGATVAVVALWFRADVTAWSLYPMYRRRLSAGFVLERIRRTDPTAPSPTAVGDEDATERPYATPYRLSAIRPHGFPEVIICASANISDYGATPSGSHVTSFTFSSQQIGGPLVGAIPTAEYEDAVKGRNKNKVRVAQDRFTTFPTAMAISGAAFSPSMGKMTRGPFRFLMALVNLRLGVWVPNPRQLDKFRRRGALLQLLPRPHYLVREMFGRNHLDAPFLYVTDGGHYENLGLVELLRRRCALVWCIDSSGDKVDTFNTLGGALQTAEAELGITVDIDPLGDMQPQKGADGGATPFVKQPYCRGTVHYPDGTTGTLVVVKAGIPHNAPLEIMAFASQNPKFPCDPTLDQLYDSDRFDAYRSLGKFSMDTALQAYESVLYPPPAGVARQDAP